MPSADLPWTHARRKFSFTVKEFPSLQSTQDGLTRKVGSGITSIAILLPSAFAQSKANFRGFGARFAPD
jgi:hypothetical protein